MPGSVQPANAASDLASILNRLERLEKRLRDGGGKDDLWQQSSDGILSPRRAPSVLRFEAPGTGALRVNDGVSELSGNVEVDIRAPEVAIDAVTGDVQIEAGGDIFITGESGASDIVIAAGASVAGNTGRVVFDQAQAATGPVGTVVGKIPIKINTGSGYVAGYLAVYDAIT